MGRQHRRSTPPYITKMVLADGYRVVAASADESQSTHCKTLNHHRPGVSPCEGGVLDPHGRHASLSAITCPPSKITTTIPHRMSVSRMEGERSVAARCRRSVYRINASHGSWRLRARPYDTFGVRSIASTLGPCSILVDCLRWFSSPSQGLIEEPMSTQQTFRPRTKHFGIGGQERSSQCYLEQAVGSNSLKTGEIIKTHHGEADRLRTRRSELT